MPQPYLDWELLYGFPAPHRGSRATVTTQPEGGGFPHEGVDQAGGQCAGNRSRHRASDRLGLDPQRCGADQDGRPTDAERKL